MKSKKRNFVLVSVAAGAVALGPFCDIALAQGGGSGGPSPAPSFLKQAGQKLFENAQKNMIRNMSDQIQQQQSGATTGLPGAGTTGVPLGAPGYGQGVPGVPGMPGAVAAPVRKTAPPMRSWLPQGRPGQQAEKPLLGILCIHGLGLQSNSYEFLGNELSKYGYAVYAIDVRGFGAWMNAKGKQQVNFNDCLADIKLSLDAIEAANPGMPIYVLGESMGGAIALRAASMYGDQVDGLISAVPAGERFNQGKTSMKVFLNLLTGVNLANVGGDILSSATKNQKLASKWQNDPLARLNLSPQELIQFQDFMNGNHAAAAKVTDMPVLFIQGNGDQLVKPEGTWELFNAVASKDKSFFAVPGEHLIFEEAQTQEPVARDQNFRVISSWLIAKVGRRGRGGHKFDRSRLSNYPGWGHGAGFGAAGSGMGSGGFGSASGAGGGFGSGYGGAGSGGFGGGGMGGTGFGGGRGFINTQGLERQDQMIANGQAAQAIPELEQLRAQRPNDPNVLRLLGRAYSQNGQPDLAGRAFRSAMRQARQMGGSQAQAMNDYFLSMNSQSQMNPNPATAATGSAQTSPWAGYGGGIGQMITGLFGFGSTPMPNVAAGAPAASLPGGGGFGGIGARGKVYAFYANWADQCKDMNNSLNQLSARYGNAFDIVRVDVDNAANDQLVDQFKVGPIPTVVFVTPSGQVSSTIIGSSSASNYEQAARGITGSRMQ